MKYYIKHKLVSGYEDNWYLIYCNNKEWYALNNKIKILSITPVIEKIIRKIK